MALPEFVRPLIGTDPLNSKAGLNGHPPVHIHITRLYKQNPESRVEVTNATRSESKART